MGNPRPSNTPPAWENQDIVLYHGTTKTNAELIQTNGIDLAKANSSTDFGKGFYTTTSLRQAQNWAWQAASKYDDKPIVLLYRLSRNSLASLDSLWFVSGDYDALDYWSLVFHCRTGNEGHKRGETVLYYDLIIGPVAAKWQQRSAFPNFDQISFHTTKAIHVLNNPQSETVED
jgi:hypothetical protein